MVFICSVAHGQIIEVDTLPSDKDSIVVGNDEKIRNDIIEYSKRDNIFSRLLSNIISEDKKNGDNGWDYSYSDFDHHAGKFIKEIEVISLTVFGGKEKNDSENSGFFETTGNAIHISTQPWIIRNQLLFKEGEMLSPFIISESERLLRNKPYIYSAEIQVMEEKNDPDSVKIFVRVRDVWSIRPDGSFDLSNNRGFLRLEDINFLGYGMSFFGAVKRKYTYGRKWSIDGGIKLDNVFREHIAVTALRESNDMGRAYRIALGRDFISPIFTWAGGIDFSWLDNHILEIYEDTFNILNEKLHRQEYWLGYATDFSRFRRMDQMQNEYYFAARFSRERFYERPIVHEYYGNHNLALISFGYSFRRYHKTRYVRHLGRVEDIPAGTIVTITSGKRFTNGQTKTYAGIKAGYSFYQRKFGYLSVIMDGGSYFTQGKNELGALNANIMYFSPLLRMGNTSTRHFITLRGGYLHNPFLFEHLLNLKRNEDIRGFPTTQTGSRRLTINYEINIYPAIRFLGFNFAAIGFVDLSWLPTEQESPWKSSFYQGIGGGFRIRNEMLVFPSIQVLMGFYPNGADRRIRFFEQPWRFYDLEFIEFNRPYVVIK